MSTTTVTPEFRAFIEDNMRGNHIEAKVLTKLVKVLNKGGNPITEVWYDHTGHEAVKVDGLEAIQNEVFNLDEAFLVTKSGDWVRFILGNEWDVISDYTTDIEGLIEPVNTWIEKHY